MLTLITYSTIFVKDCSCLHAPHSYALYHVRPLLPVCIALLHYDACCPLNGLSYDALRALCVVHSVLSML